MIAAAWHDSAAKRRSLLRSVNHPHIAAIYGLEEANGCQFLILELVEGETLARRLTAGSLAVDEVLSYRSADRRCARSST